MQCSVSYTYNTNTYAKQYKTCRLLDMVHRQEEYSYGYQKFARDFEPEWITATEQRLLLLYVFDGYYNPNNVKITQSFG